MSSSSRLDSLEKAFGEFICAVKARISAILLSKGG